MGRRLRLLVGALKDKASLTKATICSFAAAAAAATAAAAELAVLRATTHHPPSSPPDSSHIAALFSFGHGPRTSASALTTALFSRLLSTRHPSVALKSLLCLHLLLRHSPFILLDSLSSSLLPLASGHRPCPHPLFLSSSFPLLAPDLVSSSLSYYVRWYSRFLELLLLLPSTVTASASTDRLVDHLSSLLTPDLIAEISSLSDLINEAFSPPDMPTAASTRLVAEVLRLVAEDKLTAKHGILARLVEVEERFGSLGFGDAVELVYVLRRLEECRPSDVKWRDDDENEDRFFWKDVRRVREAMEAVVLQLEKDARSVAVRRGKAGSLSDRVAVRISADSSRFASNRWVNY